MTAIVLANVIFPTWLLASIPTFLWVIMLPANFLIDSLVLYLWMKAKKIDNKTEIWKKSILKIWLFGFLSDFLAAAILSFFYFGWSGLFDGLFHIPVLGHMLHGVEYGWGSVLYGLVGALIGMLFIYVFNLQWSFTSTTLTFEQKKSAARWLALITAPWMLLIPVDLFATAF